MFVKILMVLPVCAALMNTGCDELYGFRRSEEGVVEETPKTIPIPNVGENDGALVPAPRDDSWWMPRHEEKAANVKYNQKVVFIGDSITMFWEYHAIFGGQPSNGQSWKELSDKFGGRITNLGFGNDQTHNVIWRLENGEFPQDLNPEYVVLLIGTNQAHLRTAESCAAGIGRICQIINRKSPGTKILLMSLLPRKDQYTQRNFEVNEIIKGYGGFLKIQYVDFAGALLDGQGNILNQYFVDNVHLNNAGYALWKGKLLEYIE
jgi:beta-glucosidase